MPRPRPSKQDPTLMVLVLCKTRSVVLCVPTLDRSGGTTSQCGQPAGASDARVRAPQQGQPCSLLL